MPEKVWAQKWELLGIPLQERELQMRNWLGDAYPAAFKGRTVLSAGCGDGANEFLVLKSGAAHVTAVDQSSVILEAAKQRLGTAQTAFLQRDLDYEHIGKTADVVMCIGVLHHLTNRRRVLEELWRCVAPGGKLFVWVYGRRSNPLIPPLLMVRAVSKRLPFGLNKLLAFPMTLAFIFLAFAIPHPYFRQVRHFSFRHNYEIVLDQMIPKTAVYYSEKGIQKLILGLPFSYQQDRNNAGWLIIGEKK